MKNTDFIKRNTFSIVVGKVNNSAIRMLRFYVFRNNHDGTYTSVKGYHRGSTYTSFWVRDNRFTPRTYTAGDLLERFNGCEFMDETSPY